MTLCQANLKQIFLALTTYTQDLNDMLPMANCDSGASANNWYQALVIRGYLKDKRVLVCPCDPSPDTFNTAATSGTWFLLGKGISSTCYSYDYTSEEYQVGGGPMDDDFFPDGGSYGLNTELGGRALGMVTHKSKTPYVMDSVHPGFEDGSPRSDNVGFCSLILNNGDTSTRIWPHDAPFGGPHNARWHGGQSYDYIQGENDARYRDPARLEGGNCVLYLDGHVEFISGGQMSNRGPKCDTDPTKRASGEPMLTDGVENAGTEVD